MGKRRRLSQKPHQAHANKGHGKRDANTNGRNNRGELKKGSNVPRAAQKQHQQQNKAPPEPTIPFSPEERILLVGEGDLSFAASLIEHHYCADVTATVLEKNADELREKYPQVGENIAKVEGEYGRILYNVDATKMGPFAENKGKENTGVMDRIIFNFPHVGGKSTDVNRQVRYNQEMLVGFFKRAMLCLAPGGSVVVTLFEGEPYSLWNIRDLGRHVGLQVQRSFQFQASAYPGYHHARTLGVVRNRNGEIGGGWHGEDRAARSYVFVRKDEALKPVSKSKKRLRDEDGDSSEDE